MAVFTKLSRSEISYIVSQYNIGELVQYSEISDGIENTNYFITTTSDKFVLTLFEKRVNIKDLPFYLNLMNHLRNSGITCPKVMANKKDSLTFTYNTKTGIIISFLNGKSIKEIEQKHTIELGKNLAKFHIASIDYTRNKNNDFSINGIEQLYRKIALKRPFISEVKTLIDDNIDYLKLNLDRNLPKGIIHADLFPDNVFFLDNAVTGLIDFYFSCHDVLIYDLAICINAWCFKDNKLDYDLADSIIKSYNEIKEITEEELNALGNYCLLAAIRFYITRIQDQIEHKAHHNVTTKDPNEFLERIKFFSKNKNFNR